MVAACGGRAVLLRLALVHRSRSLLGLAHVDDRGRGGDAASLPQPSRRARTAPRRRRATTARRARPARRCRPPAAPSGGQSQSTVQSASTDQNAGASANSTQAPTNVGAGGAKTQQSTSSAASSTASNAQHRSTSRARSPRQQARVTRIRRRPRRGPVADRHAKRADEANGRLDGDLDPGRADECQHRGSHRQPRQRRTCHPDEFLPGGRDLRQRQSGRAGSTAESGRRRPRRQARRRQVAQSAPTTQQADANADLRSGQSTEPEHRRPEQEPGRRRARVTDQHIDVRPRARRTRMASARAPTRPRLAAALRAGSRRSSSQSAPTTQTADANVDVDTGCADERRRLDLRRPDRSRPDGSGALGTLIQIWIPQALDGVAGTQSNTSAANAIATNTNTVTQSADQTQKAGGPDSTHVGGSGQTPGREPERSDDRQATRPAVSRPATASAQHRVSSCGRAAGNRERSSRAERVDQTAEQTQSCGGRVAQLVEQTNRRRRPRTRIQGRRPGAAVIGAATSPHRLGCSRTRRRRGSSRGPLRSRASRSLSPGTEAAGSHRAPVRRPLRTADAAAAASLAGAGHARRGAGRNRRRLAVGFRRTLDSVPLDGAPWWARRQRPSAVRRLMGVVSRLERPG